MNGMPELHVLVVDDEPAIRQVLGSALGMGTTSTSDRLTTGDRNLNDGEKIDVVEEELVVGKREVNRGGVRVRSYVREVPVHEQVRLREEHVEIERRPVDRPVTDADRLFQERTIEAESRREVMMWAVS